MGEAILWESQYSVHASPFKGEEGGRGRKQLSNVARYWDNPGVKSVRINSDGCRGVLDGFHSLLHFSDLFVPILRASPRAYIETEQVCCASYREARPRRDIPSKPLRNVLADSVRKLPKRNKHTFGGFEV